MTRRLVPYLAPSFSLLAALVVAACSSSNDDGSDSLVTSATTKVVLSTTPGYGPTAPAGSTCTVNADTYAIDLQASTLTYSLCNYQGTTPAVATTGSFALTGSEATDMRAALAGITLTSKYGCAEDAGGDFADLTDPSGTKRYADTFAYCGNVPDGATAASGIGDAVIEADKLVTAHLPATGDGGVSDAGDAGVSDASPGDSGAASVVTSATTRVTLEDHGGFLPSPPDGSTCSAYDRRYTLDIAAKTLAYSTCLSGDGGTYTMSTGTVNLADSDLASLVQAAESVTLGTGTNACAADGPEIDITATDPSGTLTYSNCPSDGGVGAQGVDQALAAFEAKAPQ